MKIVLPTRAHGHFNTVSIQSLRIWCSRDVGGGGASVDSVLSIVLSTFHQTYEATTVTRTHIITLYPLTPCLPYIIQQNTSTTQAPREGRALFSAAWLLSDTGRGISLSCR